MSKYPYAHLVPKGLDANLAFRADLIRMMNDVPGMAKTIDDMCAVDQVFWTGAFGWTFDPRARIKVIPFILHPFQVDCIGEIRHAIDHGHDLCVAKTRSVGASWMLISTFLHYWRYEDEASFLLASRNEDYVDKPGNQKALFWKLDFMLKRLPGALSCHYTRTEMRLTNDDNGAAIDGESTTGDLGRGDRRTAIGLDEGAAFKVSDGYRALSSTLSTTNCRIWMSTFQGTANAFYDVSEKKDVRQVRLPWTIDPSKNRGMYQWNKSKGRMEFMDPGFEYPEGYPFVKDGRVRSPWYDVERRRCVNEIEAGQELDMDAVASTHMFFDGSVIDRLVETVARDPFHVGELIYDYDHETGKVEPIEFVEKPNGRLLLWQKLDAQGRLPKTTDYGLGADVSAGTGASNTCISGGASASGEKVLEMVSPTIQPSDAGVYFVALAKWLKGPSGDARGVWEKPGVGRIFGNAVIRTGFRNIWYSRDEQVIVHADSAIPVNKSVASLIPGWHPSPDTRTATFGEYQVALREGEFLNRSEMALLECKKIIYTDGGKDVMHSKQVTEQDPSGARANHGDRVTADALCWKMIAGRRQMAEVAPVVEEGSLAHRRMLAEESDREEQDGRW